MAELYVNNGGDACQMAMELMEAAGVGAELHPVLRVVIKPNLVVARPPSGGATTHVAVVEGIIRYLKVHGVGCITVAEGAWVGDDTRRAFKVGGYEALAQKYGVELVDTKRDEVVYREAQGLRLGLCRSVAEAEYIINVPVLKGHCQTQVTCCMKNLKGCIPDSEKRRYHSLGLHKPIAALNTLLRPRLHVVDGLCGDLTFEEGGNPVRRGSVLLGRDPVLLDSYGASLLGYQSEEVEYLIEGARLGVGRLYSDEAIVEELHPERRPARSAHLKAESGLVRSLAKHIEEDGACSACYAALVAALHKVGCARLPTRVKIGQGFKGRQLGGCGVGNCTAGCAQFVPGCPPAATDIAQWLTAGPFE